MMDAGCPQTPLSACFMASCPSTAGILRAPLLSDLECASGRKKDSLRKFQISLKNQCVDSNRSVCTVVKDMPKNGKALAATLRADSMCLPRPRRRTDDLTEPINTKIQTLPGPDFMS